MQEVPQEIKEYYENMSPTEYCCPVQYEEVSYAPSQQYEETSYAPSEQREVSSSTYDWQAKRKLRQAEQRYRNACSATVRYKGTALESTCKTRENSAYAELLAARIKYGD